MQRKAFQTALLPCFHFPRRLEEKWLRRRIWREKWGAGRELAKPSPSFLLKGIDKAGREAPRPSSLT